MWEPELQVKTGSVISLTGTVEFLESHEPRTGCMQGREGHCVL